MLKKSIFEDNDTFFFNTKVVILKNVINLLDEVLLDITCVKNTLNKIANSPL